MIDSIVERVENTLIALDIKINNDDNETVQDLAKFKKIRAILPMPSKYDSCVGCLQPCLVSRKLEEVNKYVLWVIAPVVGSGCCGL